MQVSLYWEKWDVKSEFESLCFWCLILCPAGKTDDVKVSEKGRLSPRSNGLHRSPSDAGRSSGDEAKKQTIPTSRTPTTHTLTNTVSEPHTQTHALTSRTPTSTFGFKKQGHGMVTMVTASGATITSGSATLGKMPKSGARSLSGGLKAGGQDGGTVLGHHDDGFLPMSARSTLQYRSLPRPSRSGAAARNGNRSSTSSIEAAVLSVTSHGKNSISIAKANGSASLLANQTDREKGVSEIDNLRSGVAMQSGGAATVPLTGRQQVSSPTLRRWTHTFRNHRFVCWVILQTHWQLSDEPPSVGALLYGLDFTHMQYTHTLKTILKAVIMHSQQMISSGE